jgi:hypothetical protein
MKTAAPKATFDDVNLILKLYEMRREPRLREARMWFAASFKPRSLDDFRTLCPAGSDANASYRMVTTYWEMVASFLVSGVLNPELFFQTGRELLFTWERVRPIIAALRESYKHSRELKNLEDAAQAYVAWWNQTAPGAYEAFAERVR